MRYTFEVAYPALGGDKELLETTAESVTQATAFILSRLMSYDPTGKPLLRLAAWTDDKAPILADCEKAAINALDPSLTPICVSFIGTQEFPNVAAFGLYNVEESIDHNLTLHSTVTLQTLAVYGYRPVMV